MNRSDEASPEKTGDRREAEEVDRLIVDLVRRTQDAAVIGHLMSRMHVLYPALGYRSFDAYLSAKKVRRSWAYHLRALYECFVVTYEIPEREWKDIPAGRFQGRLQAVGSREDALRLIEEARLSTPAEMKERTRRLRGQTTLRVPGHYRLIPLAPNEVVPSPQRQSMRGSLYQDVDGNLCLQIR